MFKKAYLVAMLVTAVVASSTAFSSDSPLVNRLQAYLVQYDQSGNEKLKSVNVAEPEQLIEYQLTYENISNAELEGLVITGPIPSSTEYQAKSAKTVVTSELLVSIDGGKTFESEPVKRTVRNAKGQEEVTIIPPSKYTHVRWKANEKLAAKSTQLFAYRVKVK